MHARTRGGRKKKADGKQEKNGGNKFAAVMEAAPSDGRGYSTDSLQSLSLTRLLTHLLLFALCRRKFGGGRGTGLSLVLGVGLDC